MKFIVIYLMSILIYVSLTDSKDITKQNENVYMTTVFIPGINTIGATISVGIFIQNKIYGKKL